MFQFTPARGGRPRRFCGMLARIVSIHARTWRATVKAELTQVRGVFQFTPARGGRHIDVIEDAQRFLFQFTPARGGRPREIVSFP